MNPITIQQLLEQYKKEELSASDRITLVKIMEDEEGRGIISRCLLQELDSITINRTDIDNVHFRRLLGNIKYQIAAKGAGSKAISFAWQKTGYRIAGIAAVLLIAFILGSIGSYLYFYRSGAAPESYSVIETPLASKSTISLPDGSTVMLNAGSTIKYNASFNKNNRNIHLAGEAFFKVSKQSRLPFKVITSHLDIIALGTEFNVKAYSDEQTIIATLVKGKIEIQKHRQDLHNRRPVILEPDQQAVFVKNRDNLAIRTELISPEPDHKNIAAGKDTMYVIRKADIQPAVVWTENKMIISKESLNSLAVKLERKYDVVIRFADEEVKNFRFSGTLLDETIQQVLDAIKLTSPISYTIDGKNVTLYENRKMKEKFRQHLK